MTSSPAGAGPTGDAMASVAWLSGSTEPQLHPFGEDRERMPAALAALEPLDAEVVAFGHGEPFRGSPAAAVARARARGLRRVGRKIDRPVAPGRFPADSSRQPRALSGGGVALPC